MTIWVSFALLVILGGIGVGLVAFAIWVTAAMENFDDLDWFDNE